MPNLTWIMDSWATFGWVALWTWHTGKRTTKLFTVKIIVFIIQQCWFTGLKIQHVTVCYTSVICPLIWGTKLNILNLEMLVKWSHTGGLRSLNWMYIHGNAAVKTGRTSCHISSRIKYSVTKRHTHQVLMFNETHTRYTNRQFPFRKHRLHLLINSSLKVNSNIISVGLHTVWR